VRHDFLLVSGDRVFKPCVVKQLMDAPIRGVTLAVDRSTERPSDDGLGLSVAADGRVTRVSAGRRDATWIGLAACDTVLFDVLDLFHEPHETVDLADALGRLAGVGGVRALDVPGSWWQPLRVRADRRRANRLLLNALRKPEVDGLVARNINRHFSLFVTRLLMNTSVRPNHVTAVTLVLSVVAAVVAALAVPGRAWMLGAGAALWQLVSMLDGTDGELARLKFQTSRTGEWFDTVVDDVGRVIIFLGLGWGYSVVSGHAFWWPVMVAVVTMQIVVNVQLYRALLSIGAGTHYALAWTVDRDRPVQESAWLRFWKRIEFLARRDCYIFEFMLLALVGLASVAIVLAAATTTVVFLQEVLHPRTARSRQVVQAVVVRDDRQPIEAESSPVRG
jgi:phosphatidylglycerophosphate synthase